MSADDIKPHLLILVFEHDDVEMQEWLKRQISCQTILKLFLSSELLNVARDNFPLYSSIAKAYKA